MKRRVLLLPALLLFAVAAAALFGLRLPRRPLGDDPLVESWPKLGPGEEAILFAGDVLLADGVERLLRRHGDEFPFAKLRPLFRSADAVAIVGNQEGSITERRKPIEDKKLWNYAARPATAAALRRAGFTHMSVANNHTLDRGRKGLLDTLEHLRAAGVEPFGGAANAEAALEPAVIEAGGARVAIAGAMQAWGWAKKEDWDASDERAGMNLLMGDVAKRLVARGKERGDLVIAYPHWGANYTGVRGDQRDLAAELLSAGADAVIGHHGHAAQGWERVLGKPVLWGLGNTAFGSPGRFGAEEGYGLLARLVLAGGQMRRLEFVPVRTNNQIVKYQTRPCSESQARRVLLDLAGGLASQMRWAGGVGIWELEDP
jgi:poly-gamma-glutamate synthesis protein (capsule biosynthesis protein)